MTQDILLTAEETEYWQEFIRLSQQVSKLDGVMNAMARLEESIEMLQELADDIDKLSTQRNTVMDALKIPFTKLLAIADSGDKARFVLYQ